MAEQLRRAEASREAHQSRYPNAPALDPMSQVLGDPRYRDTPRPWFARARTLPYSFGRLLQFIRRAA